MLLRARREGDVLVCAASGAFTVETARDIRAFVAHNLIERDARAVALDLRGTVQCVSDVGWLQIVAESAAAAKHVTGRVPVAIVVSPGALGVAEVHCRRLAAHGLLRLSFVDLAEALDWASHRLEHWDWIPGSAA